MSTVNKAWRTLTLVLALALAMASCGERSEVDAMAAAREQIAKRDIAAAIVELKGLLQTNPKSGEARFLLGKLQFESNDPAAAEAELRRAQEAGHPEDDVLPVLATVMLTLNKTAMLVQQYGNVDLRDRKSTRLNSSHSDLSRMPSSA